MTRLSLILITFFMLQACGGDDTVTPTDASISKDTSLSDATQDGKVGVDGGDAGAKLDGSDGAVADDGASADASDGSVADAGAGVYTAYKSSGGYDRVVIFKADTVRDVCFEVRLIAPGSGSGGLTLPSQWNFDSAKVTHDAKACVQLYGGNAQSWPVASQSGTISWAGYMPSTLDIDVTLNFSGQPAWAPSSELLKQATIPVP